MARAKHPGRYGLIPCTASDGEEYNVPARIIMSEVDMRTGCFFGGVNDNSELHNVAYGLWAKKYRADFERKKRQVMRMASILQDRHIMRDVQKIECSYLHNYTGSTEQGDTRALAYCYRDLSGKLDELISDLNRALTQKNTQKRSCRPLTFTRSTSLPRTRQRSRHTAVKRSCLATTGQDTGDPDQGDPPGSHYYTTPTVLSLIHVNFSQPFHTRLSPGLCCYALSGGEAA